MILGMLPQVWSLLKAILKDSFGFAPGNMRVKLIREKIDADMRAYSVCGGELFDPDLKNSISWDVC